MTMSGTVLNTNNVSKVTRPQRAYDYLYDPVYTVSSEADHARAGLRAYFSADRVTRVPEYGSMFSDLPHHPRYTVKLYFKDPVPPFIDRRWRGHTEQRQQALQQLDGVRPGAKSWLKREDGHCTGEDHWKYYKRPLVPSAHQVPSDVVFALPYENFESTGGKQQPSHFTVGSQTDYRESETQTDPYSPEFEVQAFSSPPEMLQLASLSWGRGLPAGLAEVEMIQRARDRKAWEKSLPPLDDPGQLDKRRRMREEMEAREWAFREEQIKMVQEARLVLLKDLRIQKEETVKNINTKRLEQFYSQRVKDKEAKLNKSNSDYLRSLRKLEATRRKMEGRQEPYGIVKNSSGSKKYSSLTPPKNVEFKSRYLDTYEGLEELEAAISESAAKPKINRHKPKTKISQKVINTPESRAAKLMKEYKALTEEKQEKRDLRILIKKNKPVPRPATPKVEEPPEGEEEIELGAIILQKLLRGANVQHKMFKGKKKKLELIQELRTVHALQTEEQQLQKYEKEQTLEQKKQRDKIRHKTTEKLAAQAGAVGAELAQLFDTLSKDLIHLQEERRIHAFTLLAERERRLREAEKSGRRQVEERRRKEEDEIFRQVVEVHQETVDLYLEDIILDALEQTADKQAREEIRRKANEVNEIAYAMEESMNTLQSEEIVSELVYSFLVPEIEKMTVRHRVHQRQRRHLQAARSIIQGAAEVSGFLPSIQEASKMTFPSERASEKVLEEMICRVDQQQGQEEHQQEAPTE